MVFAEHNCKENWIIKLLFYFPTVHFQSLFFFILSLKKAKTETKQFFKIYFLQNITWE